MKNKTKIWIFLFVIIGVSVIISTTSCKKKSEEPDQILTTNDALTKSQLQLLESAGIDTTSGISDALFPDGTKISEWALKNDSGYEFKFNRNKSLLSAFDKKRLFIERMTEAGFILVDDQQYSFPSQIYGLAYVYGSKGFDKPSKYPGATCQELLYGLDCSGMIKQMGLASNFDLVEDGTVNYVNISTWNKAFNNSSDYKGLKMADLQALPANQLQAGDLIVASGVHIGMVFSNGIDLKIFNSLGSDSYTCTKNSDKQHGPVITNNIQNCINGFGNSYHVLRTTFSGMNITNTTWDATLHVNTSSWHADVTFYENGTTKYDEPANPGVYLSYGDWSIYNNQIHWDIDVGMGNSYVFNGIISGNTMSGTWVHMNITDTWSATKR